MSCRRAFEIDLAAFLSEPAGAEHADFRAHYPTCAECAAEVAAWTELAGSLHAFGGAHPEPAALLRFEERAADLDTAQRARIEAHVVRCASCRDELRSLRAFAFEGAGTAERLRRRPRSRRSRMGRARKVLLHPAFAYAVVALLAWPAARSLLAPETRDAVISAPAESTAPPTAELRDEPAKRETTLATELERRPTSPESATIEARNAAPLPTPARRATAPRDRAEAKVQAKEEVAVDRAQPQAPARPSPRPEAGAGEAGADAQAPAELEVAPVERATAAKATTTAAKASTVRPKAEPPSAERAFAAPSPAPEPSRKDRTASEVLAELRSRVGGQTASDAATSVSAPTPGRLRIDLPRELYGEREVLVLVRDAERTRELRKRVERASGAAAIEIAVPADWPASGSFEVELRGASTEGDPSRVVRLTIAR